MCFFHYTNHNKHTGMGINGDVQHKLMSLHISSIETLNKPAHIFVYFFLFVVLLVEKKKKRDAKRSETHAQRGRTKCEFGLDERRFHMFTDDVRSGERGRSYDELLGPLKPHSHGHCSAHLCNPRLRQKELSVGYLIQMKER